MGGVILFLLMLAALYYEQASPEVRSIYVTGFILACIVYYRADQLMDRLKEIESRVTPEDEPSDEHERMVADWKRKTGQ